MLLIQVGVPRGSSLEADLSQLDAVTQARLVSSTLGSGFKKVMFTKHCIACTQCCYCARNHYIPWEHAVVECNVLDVERIRHVRCTIYMLKGYA